MAPEGFIAGFRECQRGRTTLSDVKLFAFARRLKRNPRRRMADEPALDTPEKRADLLKQIAAGITTQPGIRK
jgi:hypothetical protein